MVNMKEQNIAVIALRLLAVYLAVQIINLIPSWVSALVTPIMAHTQLPAWLIFLGLMLLVASFILPVLIWLASKKLAKFIVGDRQAALVNHASSVNISSLIFAAVGLLVFLMVFPQLVVWLCRTFVAIGKSNPVYSASRPSWWMLLSIGLKLLLSLWLIFKADYFVKSIYKTSHNH